MTCKCKHAQIYHDYQRDTQSRSGRCTHCNRCRFYTHQLTLRGKDNE